MKTYVKPELFFESFELSQHVAANCYYLPTAGGITGNSRYGMGGLFVSEEEIAAAPETYCYSNGPLTTCVYNS